MIDILSKRCVREGCRKLPMFGAEGSKGALYCRQHAEDSMFTFTKRRCSHGGCSKQPMFAAEVARWRCIVGSTPRMAWLTFGANAVVTRATVRYRASVWSMASLFCRQHAVDNIVKINKRRCSHEGCQTRTKFGVESSKATLFCRQHAEDDMVDVRTKRCS